MPTVELAHEIASQEGLVHTTEAEDDPVHLARVELYHHHLPMLSAARVIENDEANELVAPTGLTGHLGALVEIGRAITENEGEPCDR